MYTHTPLRQTIAWSQFLKSSNWEVETLNSGSKAKHIYIKRLPLIGSVVKIQHQKNPLPLKVINSILRKYKTVHITIEPYKNFNQVEELKSAGYRKTQNALIPPKTLLIDLTLSPNKLFNQMHYSGKRGIRNAKKLDITVKKVKPEDKNIIKIASALKKIAHKKDFQAINKKMLKNKIYAFGKKSVLLFAYQKGTFLGGVLGLGAEKTLHYHHAVATNKGRETYASYLLVWELLCWGKQNNYRTFDFGGIADQRFPKTKDWAGFTEFKKKFGGEELEWPRPWSKWRIPTRNSPKTKH